MIAAYLEVAQRIRLELADIERAISKAERGLKAAKERPQEQDLYLDSVALNLHDFYSGIERLCQQIATKVDGDLSHDAEWHKRLLQQMSEPRLPIRPAVLSNQVVTLLTDYLGFRHVVRNIYTFQFKPKRVVELTEQARPLFNQVSAEFLAFAQFLEQVSG